MSRENYGVVEVLDIIFVLIIATSTIAIIFLWAGPQMENKKASVRGDSALTQFNTMDDIIKDVANRGVNGSCIVDFVTDTGQVFIGENIDERFILYYSLVDGFDFDVSGLEDSDETLNVINIIGGSSLSYIDIFYLGDDTPELDRDFNGGTYTATHPLVDAIKINLKDSPGEDPRNVVGRIWLFDLGSIAYDMSSYRIITENGGTIWTDLQSGYLSNKPIIYNKDNSLVMKIIQLKPGGEISGGNLNKYSFLIKSTDVSICETKAYIPGPGYFKMQIYGDDKGAVDAWTSYFSEAHNFEKFSDDEGTPNFDESKILGLQIKDDDELFFSLVCSTCDVTLVTTK